MSIRKTPIGKSTTGFGDDGPTTLDLLLPETITGDHTFSNRIHFPAGISLGNRSFSFDTGNYTPNIGGSGWDIEYYTQYGYYSITGNSINVYFDVFFEGTLNADEPSPVTITLPFPGTLSSITGWLCPKETMWDQMEFPISIIVSAGISEASIYGKPKFNKTVEPAVPASGTFRFTGMITYFITPTPPTIQIIDRYPVPPPGTFTIPTQTYPLLPDSSSDSSGSYSTYSEHPNSPRVPVTSFVSDLYVSEVPETDNQSRTSPSV
jgi:hypothetical protein